MSILLPIEAITDPADAPLTLVLHPPITDDTFFEFCQINDLAQIERTGEGAIVMNPPAGLPTSDGDLEIGMQLRIWWKTHRQGRVTDSSAGFYLPDGSMLSPDAAYITPDRLTRVSAADRKRFPHLCPNFVIELRSRTDALPAAKQKMTRWIENGAELARLVDPYERRVHIYKPGAYLRTKVITTLTAEAPAAGLHPRPRRSLVLLRNLTRLQSATIVSSSINPASQRTTPAPQPHLPSKPLHP